MGLVKKLVIGLAITGATTAVVAGSVIGINNANNSLNSTQDNKETLNALAEIAKKLDESKIVVKKVIDESINVTEENKALNSSLYAFNVSKQLLGLSSDINLPANTEIEFELEQTNASYLNSGNLDLRVVLTNKEKDVTVRTEKISLKGFKEAKKDEDTFKTYLTQDKDNLVLNITPKTDSSSQPKYTTITDLNDTFDISLIDESGPESRRDGHDNEERLVKNETGLSLWMRNDETNGTKLNDYSLTGQVKLKDIVKQTNNGSKIYFELVPSDQTQKIVLSKGDKQIALDEIKTTNLLAEKVIVEPVNIEKEKTAMFIDALKATNKQDDKKAEEARYETVSEKQLSIDLAFQKGQKFQLNPLNVSSFVTKNDLNKDQKQLSIAISLTFGKDKNATSYKTSDQKDLVKLKEAGFEFGIFTKKLTTSEQSIKANLFNEENKKLKDYFKYDRYKKPSARQSQSSNKYPGDFALAEIKNESLKTDLSIALNGDLTPQKSENFLIFVDYKYTGIDSNKHLLTPNITLLHLEK